MTEHTPPPKKRKNPSRKRTRRKATHEDLISYTIKVSGWEYYYSLRAGDPKSRYDAARYRELATLSFQGELIRPEASPHKKAEVTLSAREGMLDAPPDDRITTIGSLSASGGNLSAYIFVPVERFSELASIAQSERIQAIQIGGSKLHYRSGSIYSVALNTLWDEDDW